MAQRRNPGLAALADVARLREAPGAYHLGFLLGPRVNAGGRVGQADLGARLLSSDDAHEVGALALRLDEFNAERRAIEREVLDQAIARIEGLYGPDRKGLPAALLVESEGWHVGVIGIVASRLVERYGRPAFVIGMDGELGKGSGRSVKGVDLGAAVLAARQQGLLINGGGHAMAAGLTVAREHIAELAAFLDQRLAPQLGAAPPVRELGIDAALAPGAATQELVNMIERAGPFGAGNALPRFALTGVRVDYAQPVGEGHVRCTLVGQQRGRLEAIAFRAGGTALGPALLDPGQADLACGRRAPDRPLQRPRKRAPADRRCGVGGGLGVGALSQFARREGAGERWSVGQRVLDREALAVAARTRVIVRLPPRSMVIVSPSIFRVGVAVEAHVHVTLRTVRRSHRPRWRCPSSQLRRRS